MLRSAAWRTVASNRMKNVLGMRVRFMVLRRITEKYQRDLLANEGKYPMRLISGYAGTKKGRVSVAKSALPVWKKFQKNYNLTLPVTPA